MEETHAPKIRRVFTDDSAAAVVVVGAATEVAAVAAAAAVAVAAVKGRQGCRRQEEAGASEASDHVSYILFTHTRTSCLVLGLLYH
jgi:hypothetical protein